ncbi:transcriptional regulator, XRE family [Actinobacteria bacterium OK074]|nr:transcriptional regulator, XRE family [Actinobacteria bacterium OK074]
MGRPERPLDPLAGPVPRLAHELRELRRAAGNPAYRAMAQAAGFSATTLSQAAAGERLPSLAVLLGYVRACGADPAEWEPRWKAAEAEAAREPADGDPETPAPYRGLARFEPDDSALFFGRDRMIEDLRELVCGHRLAMLFGASGSGKSSLLRAGLIPRIREEIARLDCPAVLRVLTPGDRPATTYGHLLAPAADEPESWVIVDQFEEAFTLCRDPDERNRFIRLLLAARDPATRLRVLIAVRADFYARCAEHRGLADALSGASLTVGPMTADELREAVTGPAQAAGHLVERELTARIVAEVLDQPGALPMLSHALLETWRRRKGRMLTLAGYEAAGGLRGSIAATAEDTYGALSADRAATARRLLLRMVEPGQGTADTRRPVTPAELTELAECSDHEVPAVVERLARARLLTVCDDGVQLAHEALLTGWPRLHTWIEEDRERLRHHRRLTEAAVTWLEHDRDPGALYRGSRLERAEELFPDPAGHPALTTTERAFLTTALDARATEQRAARRATHRSRILLGALSAVLTLALVSLVAAWRQHDDSVRQNTEDTARRVATVADALRTTDPHAAMLLGLAAWRIARLDETRRSLLGSLVQPESSTFTDPGPGSDPGRFLTASGHTLLSASAGHWSTWDVPTHRRLATGTLPQGTVLRSAPDGRTVEIMSDDGAIRLWDTSTNRWKTGVPVVDPDSFASFTPDGRSYLVDDGDRLTLYSLADGHVLYDTRAAGTQRVAPASDGTRIAACPAGHAPRVWNAADGRALTGAWTRSADKAVCTGQDAGFLVLGNGRLAAVTADGVRVWDTTTGRQLADLDDPKTQYASFSPDGTFLATADGGELRVWRLSAPDNPVFRQSLDNQHMYDGPDWDPAGTSLRYLEGGTVHTVDLSAAVTPSWQAAADEDVRFGPDGSTYVTTRRTGSAYAFELRATADGRLLRTLPPVAVPVSADPTDPVVPRDTLPLIAYSPDGEDFVYGVSAPGRESTGTRLTVWDRVRDRARATVDLPGDAVIGAALAPGGTALYTARTPFSGTLRDEVWNTRTGRRTTVLTGLDSSHLAVSPDGRLLLGDGRVAHLPSGRVTGQDLVQGDQVGAYAFGADGTLLAAGDQTGRVSLWDAGLRHRAGVLRNVFPEPLGDTPESVTAVAVSPSGRTLAVGGDAGTVQLWDVATRQPLGDPLTTPGESIDSLAFSPDDSTLYAGSAHVPLQRYTVDVTRAATTVCVRARTTGGANLTKAQWHTYIPDAGYRKLCG